MTMTDDTLKNMIEGYRDFYTQYKSKDNRAYVKQAVFGQAPKVMVISCSDSRANPSIVMQAALGDIFSVCNVANIVPPYRPDKGTHHSTSSALEFAVGTLQVEHIIVMGHSNCGGINALLEGAPLALDGEYSFIQPWVEILNGAKNQIKKLPKEEQHLACELASLKISLANLLTFPWIEERINAGHLHIHAWHFDIATGMINAYDEASDNFHPLLENGTQK